MEESLKSARSVHLVLIGVCAAIALFAASPRETDRYLSARDELEALRLLNLPDLIAYEKNLINRRASTLVWLQPQALFPNGRISTSLTPIDLFPFASDEAAAKHLRDAGTIEDWFTFFETLHRTIVYFPDEHDEGFKEFLSRIVEFAKHTPQPELQSLSFKSGVDGDAPSPMPAYAVCIGGNSHFGTVFDKTIPAVETVISDKSFTSWLAVAESAQRLRAMSATTGVSLNQLRKVRNEIGGKKIAEAAQYLEERITSSSRKINILGATIEERLAVVGAPLAALLSLLYLFMIVRHLASLPLKKADEAKTFPWILLFPGRLAVVITFVSAWLPLLVCLWLFWTSRGYSSVQSMSLSFVLLAAISATGFGVWQQVSKLRKRLHTKRS